MLLEARTTARYHATNVAPITGRDVLSRSVIVSDGTTLAKPVRLTKILPRFRRKIEKYVVLALSISLQENAE